MRAAISMVSGCTLARSSASNNSAAATGERSSMVTSQPSVASTKAVAAQAGGGVHDARQVFGAFEPHRLGHGLAASAALFAAVLGGTGYKFGVYRAVLAGGEQFQSFRPQLQPVAVIRPLFLQRQGKAGGEAFRRYRGERFRRSTRA